MPFSVFSVFHDGRFFYITSVESYHNQVLHFHYCYLNQKLLTSLKLSDITHFEKGWLN